MAKVSAIFIQSKTLSRFQFDSFSFEFFLPIPEMENRELVRRTRKNVYYSTADGKPETSVLDKNNVTEHSFVASKPIEYKKRTAKRRASNQIAPEPAERAVHVAKSTAERLKVNKKASRARRIFPTINLDATAVPLPMKIKSKKRLGK